MNFDESTVNKIKRLERLVERLKVGEKAGAWLDYDPTLAAVSGAFTTASASGRYSAIGKTVHLKAIISITNKGTASGYATITLPIAPLATFREAMSGMSITSSSGAFYSDLVCVIGATNLLRIYDGAGNTAIVDGKALIITGIYEAA